MGILKHAVLPALTLYHAYVLATTLFLGKHSYLPMVLGYNDDQSIDGLEAHLIGTIAGAHLMCIINNIVSVVQENSHYRGMAVTTQVVWLVVQWIDYYSATVGSKKQHQQFLTAIVVFSIFGLVVHVNEPGIFTKDKNKES